ncbi:MAG: hypothetical protein ABSC06_17015 [Rhodopila sp.]
MVGDGEALVVEHGGLEAGPGAHERADLLARPSCQHICCEGEQRSEEVDLVRCLEGPEFHRNGRGVDVVHDPRAAGPEGDGEPDRVLEDFLPDGVGVRWCGVTLHAFVTIAFDPPLDPHEQVCPDGLGACVAAPQPAKQAGDEEQKHRAHDQDAGKQPDVLRPKFQVEEVETFVRYVQQHRLGRLAWTTVPPDPGQQIVDRQADDQDRPFYLADHPMHGFRIDLYAVGIEMVAGGLPLELQAPLVLAEA